MKSYKERGVQAGSSLLHSRTLPLDVLAPSPEGPSFAIREAELLSPLEPSLQVSTAYSHSPTHGSSFSRTEVSHGAKPRQLPQLKPSAHRHSSVRVFSLPEDFPSVTGKSELGLVQRVVSMPEQRLSTTQIADSSLSTEGLDGSMLSGGSFLSGTDTTSDSVLIIENNCGLSEAFLSNQNTTKATSPVSERIAPSDEGWITWAKSPPRPIPALHGPLSLPYARCPSGAEGTIIEEPDNLPRVIWGLDSEGHHATDFGSDSQVKQQEITALPSQPVRHSPRHYKSFNESAVTFTRAHSSVATMLSPGRAGPDDTSYSTLKPATSVGLTGVIYSRNPYNETIVLENLVDRRTTRVVHRDHDYDATSDMTRMLEHNLHLRESGTELQGNGELDRNLPSRIHGSRNSLSSSRYGLPAMRVSSRPAVGSALPQILIEPRSPEVSQVPSRRMTAMELAHQYQQHQLLKMQQQSLLPTPPNSSSPLWSSEFSPYNHHSVSPALRHTVAQEQLRDSEVPDQLRHLVRERLGRNIVHDPEVSPLAPAAQINSVSRLDYPDYELDPVTSQALTNLLAAQDIQHLPPLPSEVLLPVTRAPQALPGYLGHDVRRYSAPHHDVLLSPTSPGELRYTRGHSQHQIPRSVPLARLMQRRLSSVPEEDSSPTIHGRSPSPPQAIRHSVDRPYLHPPAQHRYQYADIPEPSASYSGPYLESTSHGSQGKVRGPIFCSKGSTVGADVLDAQGHYRLRRDGSASERECAIAPKRAGGLRKTRGRPPKFHAN
ncbi:hypothetical protein BJV78DRAFT_1351335 [Lactifluus subvellereus]|nr:hypothetical protein BJV78DRAFT_1351335 [Lactifluus subvellereus]